MTLIQKRLSAALVGALLAACGGGVAPDGVYLSLSVSTGDVAVETTINGEANGFFSGTSGNMAAAGPINPHLREGENEITFALSRAEDVGDDFEPWILASLEVALKGDIVDTMAPGDRTVFSRELTEDEASTLEAGTSVVIIETFNVSRERLEAMKAAAK